MPKGKATFKLTLVSTPLTLPKCPLPLPTGIASGKANLNISHTMIKATRWEGDPEII
jgi:hypothetical protein